ncbi:MAG TPA: FAD-dependent oxidoreductase [Pseudobacteroides sp.]|uniref:NAD(P)/FAD-dependent oxidoreductase n=1 Tax=Pseudobacteroides sp. TaxID=1968840 RepID=UPI002F94CC88
MKEKFIIAGNGITAINAAKAIREINSDVEIHMFGDERYYPYNRIKLSKSLLDKLEEDALLLQKKDWYEANGVYLHLNVGVAGIDASNNQILLNDGSKMGYDKLLIASGARNFKPPIAGIDNPGIFTIRQLEDAWNIHQSIEGKSSVLNIGGGIQGLETAWILHQHGKKVIIAEISNRLMPNQLDQKASRILLKILKNYNIDVLLDTQVESIICDKQFECTAKNKGTIKCDMVIYSAGIRPNIEFLRSSPVDMKRGVIVDREMRTNIENIYAAGDAAELEGKVTGLWNIAIEQGKAAGYNMAGRKTEYRQIVPVTTLNAFNISLFSMGNVNEGEDVYTITEEDAESNLYKRLFIKNDRIIGAIVIGDTKKSPALKTAIEKEVSLENIDIERISIDDLMESIKKVKECKV